MSAFRSLEGTPVFEILAHLDKLLYFGLKLVPSPHSFPFLRGLILNISHAHHESQRVLIWNVHFMIHSPEVDLFEVLPYSHFHNCSGLIQPNKISEGCGSKVHVFQNMLSKSKDRDLNFIQQHCTRALHIVVLR